MMNSNIIVITIIVSTIILVICDLQNVNINGLIPESSLNYTFE